MSTLRQAVVDLLGERLRGGGKREQGDDRTGQRRESGSAGQRVSLPPSDKNPADGQSTLTALRTAAQPLSWGGFDRGRCRRVARVAGRRVGLAQRPQLDRRGATADLELTDLDEVL